MQVIRGLLIDAVRGYIHYYLAEGQIRRERWTLSTFASVGAMAKALFPTGSWIQALEDDVI